MKRAVSVAFIVMSVLAALSAAHAAPKIEASPAVWDFGDIYQWTNPSTTVEITNRGDQTLEITDILASCGCTAVFLDEKTVAPGKSVAMRIEFASYLLTGKINKIVRLSTNDPAAREFDVRVTGNVSEEKAGIGTISPEYLDLGVVAPYETRYIDAVIKNSGNADLSVRDIALPDGFFMDSATPTRAKIRDEVALRFGYRPPVAKGPIDSTINISTSGRTDELLGMRVVGYVGECASAVDGLVVTPTGYRTGPDGGSLVLSVKNRGGSTVTVEGVDSSLDATSVDIGDPELSPGETGKVSVTLEPAGLTPGSKGYLYIRIGIPVEVGPAVDGGK